MFWNRCSEHAAELRGTDHKLGGYIFYGSTTLYPDDEPDRWNWHIYTSEERDWTKGNNPLVRPAMHAHGHTQHLWLAIDAANTVIDAFGYDAPEPNDVREPDPHRTDPQSTPAQRRQEEVKEELRRRAAALPKFPPHVIAEHAEKLFSHPDCIGR